MLPLFFSPQVFYKTSSIDNAGRSNIYETETSFVVELEAAGFTEDSIQVSLENNVLSICGEIEISLPDGFEQPKPRTFSRRFRIGAALEEDAVSAKFSNGLLTVELPKKSPRTITLNAS